MFKSPWRISGISGILFVALSLFASFINKMPPAYNQDSLTFALWFSENGQWFRAGHLIAGIAFVLFYFPFFAGFCERLAIAEGMPAIWTRVTWAGAIMSPAIGTIAGAFITGLALLGGKTSADISQYGLVSNYYAYVVSGAFGGLVSAASAIVILKKGVFARWLGWSGLVIGLAAVTSLGTIVENDPHGIFAALNGIAWLAYFLWIGAVSVEMISVSNCKLKITSTDVTPQ